MSVLVREILESHNATLFLIKAEVLQTIVILKKNNSLLFDISVNVIH